MSPALERAIVAAEALAWLPTSNLPAGPVYDARRSAADCFFARMAAVGSLSANASDELRFLLAAMERAARCSFANRMGEPYYERREAIYQLRGCLDVWSKSAKRTRRRAAPDAIVGPCPDGPAR